MLLFSGCTSNSSCLTWVSGIWTLNAFIGSLGYTLHSEFALKNSCRADNAGILFLLLLKAYLFHRKKKRENDKKGKEENKNRWPIGRLICGKKISRNKGLKPRKPWGGQTWGVSLKWLLGRPLIKNSRPRPQRLLSQDLLQYIF